MNYADIMWKLVEIILNEKNKEETTNSQSNNSQTED